MRYHAPPHPPCRSSVTAKPPTRRPRLCMVVDNTWPDIRVEREALAAQAAGWDVDVICAASPGEPAQEVSAGLTIHRLPIPRERGKGAVVQLGEYVRFTLLAGWRVARLHRRRRFDVVHLHNVPDFLVFAALVPKLDGSGVILDLHDLMPEFFASRFRRPMHSLPVRLLTLQERISCRLADHVVTVTERWRRRLVGRGIPASKVSVVMNLPDPGLIPATRANRSSAGDRFTILYHGTLTHRYGVDLLIRAVADLRNEMPARLVIHGRGEYLDELRRLSSSLEMDGTVEFSTEYLPTAALPGLIRSADVGVVPYRRDVFTDEILPTKLLEYAALGVPAVVARTSVIEDYFDPSMVAYFTPGDVEGLKGALRSLHKSATRRRTLAAAARRFAKQNTWTAAAATYVELLDTLRRDRRRSRRRTRSRSAAA
jgi:glycosyltransferase involved in cell wall biosynthesis